MKNLFLKQIGFLVMGMVLAASVGQEARASDYQGLMNQSGGSLLNSFKGSKNENFVMQKVKDYSGSKDHTWKQWEEILESPWAAQEGFAGVKHNKMYDKISKQIDGLKNKSMSNFESSFSKDINDLNDDMQGELDSLSDTFSTEAWSTALDAAREDAKKLGRAEELGITREAMESLLNQKDQISRTGPGVPTLDVGNIAIGIYNVDSVIETYHYDEDIRDHDTRACAEMGVSGLSGGNVSTGEFCCLLWEESGDSTGFGALKGALAGGLGGGSTGAAAGAVGGAIGAWDGNRLAEKRARAGYDYCCSLSDDKAKGDHHVLCQAQSAAKAECLNGELSGGSSAEDAWKACSIECGDKDFGSLSYNEDGKYDPNAVNKLMKECYREENKWSPSTTVPTSDELAPVIPEVARKSVTGKEGGK